MKGVFYKSTRAQVFFETEWRRGFFENDVVRRDVVVVESCQRCSSCESVRG